MICDNCDDFVDFVIKIRRSFESYREGLEEYRTMWIDAEWCPRCFNDEINKIKWHT